MNLSAPPHAAQGRPLRAAARCALVLGLGTAACSSPPLACRVTPDGYTAPEDGTVSYGASVTGAATIKSVVYRGQDKPVTVAEPTLPFELQVPVASGASIAITVYGSIDNGEEGNVLVSYSFLAANGGNSYEFHASCR